MSVVAASDGQCTLQWRVDDSLLNTQGTMHGGLITSVIDTATTTVLRSMGRKVPGVSVELSVRYEITYAFKLCLVIVWFSTRSGRFEVDVYIVHNSEIRWIWKIL